MFQLLLRLPTEGWPGWVDPRKTCSWIKACWLSRGVCLVDRRKSTRTRCSQRHWTAWPANCWPSVRRLTSLEFASRPSRRQSRAVYPPRHPRLSPLALNRSFGNW